VALRISRGESAPVEEAITGLAAPYLAASPDGRRVVFFTKAAQNRPEAFDVAQVQRQTFPFTLPLTPWQELPALGQQVGPEPYRAIWHPDGNQVAFYNDTGFYLADLATGQICEVDLGPHVDGKRWTFHAQWSPNGRYLAALTTVGDPAVGFSDLTLIDTNTGERRHLDLGLQYLYAITWAPNSRDLLVVAEKGTNDSGLVLHGLYVVNAATGDTRQMLADHQFVGTGAWGVAWSPTGQAIALACPVVTPKEHLMTEGRLCIVSVEVTR
jgi:Tol biopolymer transport system component